MTRQTSNSLAPGFRFHPTDEELVRYYLDRKVSGKPLRFNPISEIDIYKSEPWDLPDKSKLKSRDLEWYFFSALDRKYGNGSKTNRATEKGYWKTTGKDRAVKNGSKTVGMKKTLVYHHGRAPRGERTNWVMHEYRLADEESEKVGITQDAFVLCRVFKKSGSGPKNGEQYGAPFVEEEWDDDDEVGLFPGQEFLTDEVGNTKDAHVRSYDCDQTFVAGIGSNNTHQANFYPGESSNSVENSGEIDGFDSKSPSCIDGITFDPHQQHEQNSQKQYEMDTKPVGNDQYNDGLNPEDIEYLLNGRYFDASDNPLFGVETNDPSNVTQNDAADFDVEDYLTFFDADDNDFIKYGASELVANENPPAESVFSKEPVNSGTELVPAVSHLMESHGKQEVSTSKHQPLAKDVEPKKDSKYTFMSNASSLLESFPAPPAFASEFPAKDALLKLGSFAHESSSVNLTAGFIKIRDMGSSGNAMDWSIEKSGQLNITLSIGLPQSNTSNSGPVSSILSGKTSSTVSRSWLYCLFFWVLILSVSIKVGIAVCIR